ASIVRLDPAVVAPIGAGGTVNRVGIAIPLTRFIGRESDLLVLREARREHRLVTIVGPAGVGKTRIAVELAREATTALDDDQYMVDLADVRDPDHVVAAIASVVRARELSIDGIVRRLSRGRVLLILDNADHVIGALAAAVDALLARTEQLRIVVTSRESLRLAEEHVVVLRPLIGDDAEDAWRLFSERAADARGGRAFHDAELEQARELCAQLEGIPLALELAAARLDVLDVEQVREGIGGRGTGTGRHDSVRAAIGWTFDELGDEERALLSDLARFAGTFTVGAAAGTSGLETARTSDLLMQLVGRSLVAVDRSGTGRRRFRVLESTREFLADREDPVRAAEWRLRHRAWYADLVSRLGPTMRTFESRDTMAVLDGFRADLSVAFEGAIEAGDRDAAVRLAGWQAQYWFLRGLLREGRSRVERAL
ncbi:ATP-binding protein, partial [Microbacterium sp. CPCC 204701]|uniref:ATP-binding protein n=1 Tax=Microbacterium sp. CPCC 204701 TaxID=2493084 RepID=UPI000FDCDABC